MAKGILVWLLLLLMCFPALNHHYKVIRSAPLKGVGVDTVKPIFSMASWWNGAYQEGVNNYINDMVSFREDMIRLNNEIDYLFFSKFNTDGVILGRHHNLFYMDYIDAYCGTDYAGDNYPTKMLVKMKKVQDTLERMGKLFVFIQAPSKASYSPEDIPAEMACSYTSKTNYSNYKRIADSLGIHQIDFNAWYVSLKGKTPHSLFNHQGIHWSFYGAFYAIDSLIHYIECRRGIHMMHPQWSETEHVYKARGNEDDMERILNLAWPLDTDAYWYHKWQYDDSSGQHCAKPRVVYIGDSFIGTLTHDGITNINTDPEYWYYFRDVWVPDPECPLMTSDMKSDNWKCLSHDMNVYDWKAVLQKADCIIVLYCAPQLVKYSDAFTDSAYNYYYPLN